MGHMIAVNTEGRKRYHPEMDGDPLRVEKGWSHFRHDGEKDFLNRILAYRLADGGMDCQVETFRGRSLRGNRSRIIMKLSILVDTFYTRI